MSVPISEDVLIKLNFVYDKFEEWKYVHPNGFTIYCRSFMEKDWYITGCLHWTGKAAIPDVFVPHTEQELKDMLDKFIKYSARKTR